MGLTIWFLLICLEESDCGVVKFSPEIEDVLKFRAEFKPVEMSENIRPEIDPEIRPRLFEGDIAIDEKSYKFWRVGLRWDVFPEKLWPNRTIPYAISPLYDAGDRIVIYQAIRQLNFMTCVNFVPWNGKAEDYLLIWPIQYPRGCWSFVGRIGGAQLLSLQPPDRNGPNCLGTEGRAIHELMHALGIFHEQSRADRDYFVDVKYENIIEGECLRGDIGHS